MTVDVGTARGRIEIDTVGVQKSLASAQKALNSFGNIAGAAFGALGIGAGAAAAAVVKSGVSMNALLETTQLQFETLMGSADAARTHVADLFEIAKKTPFETEPIIAASKALRTFGGDALDTKERLVAVGDAAAATGGPIDDLAFWVGRLYSNLQGGQPFGEAAMRLQELAVLSPQARQEMEALQKSGASAEEVFAVFEQSLGRFGGAMARQAETLPGLAATFKDAIKLGLGDAFEPVFEGLKTGLKEAIAILDDPATTEGIANFAARLGQITAAVVPFVVEHGPALLKLLGSLAVALGAMSVAAKVGAVVLKLSAAWGAVSATVAAGGTALSAIVALLGGPVTLAIGAVVAAVGVLAAAWTNDWGGIREKTAAAWDFISGKVAEGMAALRRFIEPGLAAIRAFWEQHWEALKRLFQYGWDGLVNTFKVFQALFTGDWEELGRLLRERFENAIDAISDIMWHLWDAVGPALIDLAARIVTWWNGIDWRALARKALEELKRGLAEGGQGGGDDPLRLGGLMTGGAMSSGYEAGQRARAAFVKGWQEEGVAADEIFSPEATREQNRLAVAAKKVAQEAAGADRVLGQYAQGINAITRSSDRASGNIRALDLYLAQTRDHLKLDAERSLHFAAGIDALTAAAARNKAGLDAAAQAAQSYATAFAGVQADYVTELPQADEPMVNPEHDVTIRTRISGPTAEQAELAARYNDELEKLRETYAELTGGVGTFGMEQDKLDEKIGAVAAEMDYYQGLLDGLPPVVDSVSTAHQGLAVNVDAVHQAIYDALIKLVEAGETTPEVAAAYAAAVGIMGSAQAEAALQAAVVKLKIDELAASIAAGMPIDQALADLDAFIAKIEQGVNPAAQTLATDVPARVTEMKDAMSEEALGAGEAVPTNIASGITDNLDVATTAATDAADAITNAVREAHGIESPSSVFAEIGGQDIAGFVAGVEDAQGDAVAVMEAVGQATVDAWDSTIEAADGIGTAMIDGVIAGVESKRGALVAKMQEIARAAYQAAMDEIDAHSPSRLFIEYGADTIIGAIVQGLDEEKDTLYGKMTEIAGELYRVANAGLDWLGDPLELELRTEDDAIEETADRMTAAFDALRTTFGDTVVDNLLKMTTAERAYFAPFLRNSSAYQNNIDTRLRVDEALSQAGELNRLEQERLQTGEALADVEERRLSLEKERSRLNFLQAQIDLVDTVRELGLSASILEGLELGLDANAEDLAEAMQRVIQQLIAAAEDELEIASPSRVGYGLTENFMDAMTRGIADNASGPVSALVEAYDAMRDVSERMALAGVTPSALTPGGPGWPSAAGQPTGVGGLAAELNQHVTVYGGYNVTVAGRPTADPMRDQYYAWLGVQKG